MAPQPSRKNENVGVTPEWRQGVGNIPSYAITPAPVREITQRATQRYLADAVFHARVERAVQTMEGELCFQLDQHDSSLVRQAISVALVLDEIPGGLR